MAHCYICGNPILDTKVRRRRKVKTGEHDRRRYPGGRVVSVQYHYGYRIVCLHCARRTDRRKFVRQFKDVLLMVAALVLLTIALLVFKHLY